ncbi:MAG: transcription antitermination factor NusB [Thermoguttaceae bacterium]|nr:transcription antitermination factor NusB [Thermoguttaceae bacterium]
MNETTRKQFLPLSIGRALALQAMYQAEANSSAGRDWADLLDSYCEETQIELSSEERDGAIRFALRLFYGLSERLSELDQKLNKALDRRTLKNTTLVDRNILRVGAYEALFIKTPKAVVISEAIELALQFGSKNSIRFINGVLDRVVSASEEQGDAAEKNSLDSSKLPEPSSGNEGSLS